MSLALLLGIVISPNQIKANDEFNNLRNSFLEAGVSEKNVDNLIEKVNNGEILDSLNPEKEPINIITKTSGDSIVTIQEYEDGSTSKFTISPTSSTEKAGTVSGGTKTTGSYWMSWKKAKVSGTYGTISCYFHADIEAGNGYSTITKVYDMTEEAGITAGAGTVSNKRLRIITPQGIASTGQKAEARFSFDFTAVYNSLVSTVNLRLYVTGGGVASAVIGN